VALEIWIMLALAAGALVVAAVTRLRRNRRRAAPQSEHNVYPLW